MSIGLPLTLSVAGHAICLALLMFLLSGTPPLPEPIAKGGIEVVFQPALPKSEAAPLVESALQPETPPPPAEAPPPDLVPPTAEPQIAAIEPVPPVPETPATVTEPTQPTPEPPVAAAESTSPPPKPAVKRPPKPAQRQEQPQPTQAYLSSPQPQLPPGQTAPAAAAPPQTASTATPFPAPVPSPDARAGYRAQLTAWFESHKRYPYSARQRGEEGSAVMRFEVDRNGRVVDYAIAKSSGYPDLDAAIEEMMRGAILPPFPAGMTQPRVEEAVMIQFSLSR